MFIELKTACGKKSTWVDYEDLEMNPLGAICCEECVKIIVARKEVIK